MSREDVMFYAGKWGPESAAFLLLLCGPDNFGGSYEEYEELIKELDEMEVK